MGLNLRLRRLAPQRALDAAALRLLTTLPELDPADAPNLRQVGPLVSWSPRVAAAEPTVVISMSTFGYPGMTAVLQNLVDATAGLDARVLVSTGPGDRPGRPAGPRPGRGARLAAARRGAARRTVLVTHGGHGSAMTGLAHDLPLLVVPLDSNADHQTVGRSIVAAGAGRVVSRSATAAEIRSALADVGRGRAARGGGGPTGRSDPGDRRGRRRCDGARGAQRRSSGARSPRGSTVIAQGPASRASWRSSAESSSAVSGGAPGSA